MGEQLQSFEDTEAHSSGSLLKQVTIVRWSQIVVNTKQYRTRFFQPKPENVTDFTAAVSINIFQNEQFRMWS